MIQTNGSLSLAARRHRRIEEYGGTLTQAIDKYGKGLTMLLGVGAIGLAAYLYLGKKAEKAGEKLAEATGV